MKHSVQRCVQVQVPTVPLVIELDRKDLGADRRRNPVSPVRTQHGRRRPKAHGSQGGFGLADQTRRHQQVDVRHPAHARLLEIDAARVKPSQRHGLHTARLERVERRSHLARHAIGSPTRVRELLGETAGNILAGNRDPIGNPPPEERAGSRRMSGDEQRVRGVRVVGIDVDAHAACENGACYAVDFMKGGYSRRLCESRPQCRGIAGSRIRLQARDDRRIDGTHVHLLDSRLVAERFMHGVRGTHRGLGCRHVQPRGAFCSTQRRHVPSPQLDVAPAYLNHEGRNHTGFPRPGKERALSLHAYT